MNVAFEQIHRTFEVPKPVMHLIVHHVRPRAPPPPAGWPRRWVGSQLNLYFGEKIQLIRYKRRGTATWCDARCLVHGEPDYYEVCVSCARPITAFHYITHCDACCA